MKIYLATPYTHSNGFIEHIRFKKVSKQAGELIKQGYIVFSPISHSHPIAHEHPSMPRNYDFWMKQDEAFIRWCDELWIYCQDGWEDSVGVTTEWELAVQLGKPIRFVKEE